MPRTLSIEEYKELGKRYYGRKDYQRALNAFTDGIDASVGRDIQLYDYRAAVFEKLEKPSDALADARHMIKAFEKDPKGYLRAGQLLLNMDKKQQALQIYARGLKYVPSTYSQINLLRGAHDKLNRELCPPKAVDPFTQLPQEIVEMIMSYLRFHELVSCLRVSKQWKLFLQSLPNLWTKVDLFRAGSRRNVKPSFLKTVARMSQNRVQEARIANLGHKGYLLDFVVASKALEKLEFVQTSLGTQSMLEAVIQARALKRLVIHGDTEVHGDTITSILKHRPALDELRIHHVGEGCSISRVSHVELPNLKVLDVRNVSYRFLTAYHLTNIVHHAINLEELTYEDQETGGLPFQQLPSLKHMSRLRYLHLRYHHKHTYPEFDPLNIRVFELYGDCRMVDRELELCARGLPNVEILRVNVLRVGELEVVGLMPLLLDMYRLNEESTLPESASLLKSIEWSDRLPIARSELMHFLEHPRLSSLEELVLDRGTGIEFDDTLIHELVALKKLRRLQLNSAQITGVGLKQLVNGLKGTLEHVTLKACDKVGHDAAVWAAQQGVEMVVHESEGRVVRRAPNTGSRA